MKKSKKILIIFSIALLLLTLLLENIWINGLHPFIPGFILFFFIQSILIEIFLDHKKKKVSQFPIYFIASICFRFFSALLVLLICYWVNIADYTQLAYQFVILYLAYLFVEIKVKLPKFAKNKISG